MFRFDPKPPEDAYQFWQEKGIVTKATFDRMSHEARAQAFTVAGLAKLDQIVAVHEEIAKAMEEGKPFKQFQKDVLKRLPKGWVESPYRLETIYRTNMQSAYQAGRYQQMKKVEDTMPFWRYVAVGDRRTRPSHSALHGTIRRSDDPFWDSYYPPNGFRCRCTVQALSQRMVDRKGYEVGEGVPKDLEYRDPVTGLKSKIDPVPDKGFEGNVGKARWEADWGKHDKKIAEPVKKAVEKETGLAPLGVKTKDDVAEVIKNRLSCLAGKGIDEIVYKKTSSYLMATDTEGIIYISTAKQGLHHPSEDLLNAFKKIGTESKLSFVEEESFNSLWHEIQHHNQKWGKFNPRKDKELGKTMETINEWVSRRTYPRMLTQLGGYEPQHLEDIKKKGAGYANWVKRFDDLLEKVGVQEEDILGEMERIHRHEEVLDYPEKISTLLAKKTGKRKDYIRYYLSNIGSNKGHIVNKLRRVLEII